MAEKKTIDIVISTLLKATGIDAAKRAMRSLSDSTKRFAATVGTNLNNIKAGFDIVAVGAQKFLSVMAKGMEFERMTVQFKSLTGSMEMAKAHMRDLQDLGRTPPFSLEQFAAASQAMLKMTGGMAGFKREMEIVGDMAAATGNDIATVGRAFGLAYQVIRDGQDFGRAGQQLYSLGIMTKKQVSEFAELSKAGSDNAAVWEKLQEVFGRYKGAMAETEKTTKGVVEAIEGEATVAITEFSSAISESAKPALEGLLGYLKRINEDGTIEDWADRSVDALEGFYVVAQKVGNGLSWLFKASQSLIAKPMAAISAAKEAQAQGMSVKEADAFIRTAQRKTMDSVWSGAEEQDAEREERKAERVAEKKRKRKEQAAAAEAEAERRIKEDLAKAQEETDRKADKEKAKADREAAEKAEAARLKAVEAERKVREKAEADLHAQRIANIKAELQTSQNAVSAANNVASNAQTEFDKAFGMYRSEDRGAAQIAEERDYAADYKQLQKDASRYGGKWRIDELSNLIAAGDTQGQAAKLEEWRKSKSFTPEVESMVRAAAADQTKTSAEDELRKLNETSSNIQKRLEDILAEGGE